MTITNALKLCRVAGVFAVVCLLALAFQAPPVHGQAKKSSKKPAVDPDIPARMPWSLRKQYTITSKNLRLDYSEHDGEWRVRIAQEEEDRLNPVLLVRDVGFAVELADGRILSHDALGLKGPALCSRDRINSELLGPGTTYTVNFVPADGLIITHHMTSYDGWPFVLMTLTLHNSSEMPVTVRRLVTASMNAGSISGFSAGATATGRHVTMRGGSPVFDKNSPPTRMVFHDPALDLNLGIGVLPNGRGRAGIEIQGAGGTWQGRIVTEYQPGVTIRPQETLESDPLWISLGMGQAKTDQLYTWALNSLDWPVEKGDHPRAWVTVPDTEDFSGLKRAAKEAMSLGVLHALIPGNWEGRPGTMEGGAPRYPKDMTKAVKELRDLGCTPGITTDPLAVQGGSGDWAAKSADGQTWVNPAHPDGGAFLRKEMEKLIGMGFGFVVIEPSRIPDEVLAAFGISRTEADWRAIGAASAAAKGAGRAVFVYPSSAARLKAVRDEWLEAAGNTCRFAEYSLNIAPVRFEVSGLTGLDPELATAIRLWKGPLELVGAPAASGRADLAKVLAGGPLQARPQDPGKQVPLLWLSRLYAPAVGDMGMNVLAFSGAPAWNMKDLDADSATPLFMWRPEGEAVVAFPDGAAPANNSMTAYGLCPELTRPTYMGVSKGDSFGLEKTKTLVWNEEKGVLAVAMNAGTEGDTFAYVALAGGWKPKQVKVGGDRVKAKADDRWLVFPMAAGKSTFEVTFEK
ncbi:MAG: hypothetical protein H3C30_03570 [Candidatus Hydrogenedentes bacterium]|nr:hypothetical protein [Candidatus Hydrogenedentota bacterium]